MLSKFKKLNSECTKNTSTQYLKLKINTSQIFPSILKIFIYGNLMKFIIININDDDYRLMTNSPQTINIYI